MFRQGVGWSELRTLRFLGHTSLSLWAAKLWGAAENLRQAISTPISPRERTTYENAVSAIRMQLGEEIFAKTLAEGRSMTPDQALAAQG
jgi:hypothetical protein